MKLPLSTLLLLLMFFACSKTPVAPPPTPPTSPTSPTNPTTPAADSNLTIHYGFPEPRSASEVGTDFELIITQVDGTVLLDTIAPFNTLITATMKTKQKLVNVTTIEHTLAPDEYSVNMYTAVDPRNWKGASTINNSQTLPATVPATMVLTHVPKDPVYVNTPGVHSWFTGVGDTTSEDDASVPGQEIISYRMVQNDYFYVLLSDIGTYTLHAVKSAHDTIDLSHMDTAVRVIFNKPPSYTSLAPSLTGIIDTTNAANTTLKLFNPYPSPGAVPADLLYPKKVFQKYQLLLNANNSAYNEFATYNALLDSIPTTLPLPTAADYAITSTQNDNFSVSFHLSGITSYGTEWSVGKVLLNILANPDSTNLHPLSLLSALKSRKLQGQSLGGLKLTGFDFQTVQGLNYSGYFNRSFDSTSKGPSPNYLAYFKDLE